MGMRLSLYNINNLSLDLEKKLSLYKVEYSKKQEYHFHDEMLKEFSSILIKIEIADVYYDINNFNKKYKVDLELKKDSLEYPWHDINNLSSELYMALYYTFKDEAFNKFLDIIQNKLPKYNYYDWLDLSFKDNEIKNHFLENATEYIIQNQMYPKQWINNFENIDVEKYRWLRDFNLEKIPKKFNDIDEIYFWFKKNGHQEYLRLIGSGLVDSLLFALIRLEATDPHTQFSSNKRYTKVNRLLEECSNDYIVIGNILTSQNISLDTYFLTQRKYAIYGFLNLYNIDSAPNDSINDDNVDYVKQWKEMLAKQLVNIYVEHFKFAQHKDDFAKSFYNVLNFLVSEHVGQYNNQYNYKANYTLEQFLEKISSIVIAMEYDKKYLFEFIVDYMVNKQLKNFTAQNEFNTTDYFLLSWYVEQLDSKQKITDNDYSHLINNITTAILNNIKKCIDTATNEDKFYVDEEMLKKINFGLIYKLSTNQDKWLYLLDSNKIKEQLNGTDIYMPRKISTFYIKILLRIFKDNSQDNIAQYLTQLVIDIGIKERNGVFGDWQDNNLLNEFLEISNSLRGDFFENFSTELYKQKKIKNILQLYNSTFIESRKVKIKEKLDEISELFNDANVFYLKELEDAMMYASVHAEFKQLNYKLFHIYKKLTINKGHPSRKREYAKIICKKELLDIYYNNELDRGQKHIKLNDYSKNIKSINDKNWGEKSTEIECENYQSFIHAIVWFETQPIKTYKLLRLLCDKKLENLYLINMLSAYFKAFEDDKYKIEKYTAVLQEYENYAKKLNNQVKTLFDYQILIYGYTQIKNTTKLLELDAEIPSEYIPLIKKELPKEITFFDSKIIMKSKLVICMEGEFDIKFLMNINQNIEEFKEIVDLKTEKISLIPLNGGNLTIWIEKNHLQGSNIIEVHIFDSDINSGNNSLKYKKDCDKVNARGDASVCFLTKKREMENYIHKSLIEGEFEIDMSQIDNWDIEDIPTFISNRTSFNEKDIKNILNGKLSKRMTKTLLEDIDGFEEIKNWFEKIKKLMQ